MKILVADPIDKAGIDFLRGELGAQLTLTGPVVDVKIGLKPEELKSIIGEYNALMVRSETKVTAEIIEAAKNLQVIARAGVGVDNIDVNAATRRGVVVVNAPTSNIVAAAEHTIALMLALARNIPQANVSLKKGEWRRKDFMGAEIRNKTLGIIGLGRVGSEVARRAKGLEMRVIAHDPFVSKDYAQNMGVEMVSLEALFKQSDIITVHTALTDATKGLIGAKELSLVKPTAFIINTARGGIIDEEALYHAVEEGRVAGAAVDVFSQEPAKDNILLKSNKIIVTPHLGASTTEAQASVAVEAAEQVLAVLRGEPATHMVNMPLVMPEVFAILAPFIEVATCIGKIGTQLAEGQLIGICIKYEGDIANYDTAILKGAALGGLLEPISEERVNMVNANLVAASRGLKVVEQKGAVAENYASLLTLEVTTSAGSTVVSGTAMRGQTHIVRINDYWMDVIPSVNYLLVTDHKDRPGMIGAVGTITGSHDINISFMEVSRLEPRGRAMMVLGLDEPLTEEPLKKIRAISGVYSAKVVRL